MPKPTYTLCTCNVWPILLSPLLGVITLNWDRSSEVSGGDRLHFVVVYVRMCMGVPRSEPVRAGSRPHHGMGPLGIPAAPIGQVTRGACRRHQINAAVNPHSPCRSGPTLQHQPGILDWKQARCGEFTSGRPGVCLGGGGGCHGGSHAGSQLSAVIGTCGPSSWIGPESGVWLLPAPGSSQ